MSDLSSSSGSAQKTAVASFSGTSPSVHPARTMPSELTATPFRSPPENSSSVSRSKVRVPTAPARDGKRTTATVAAAKARGARRMGPFYTNELGRTYMIAVAPVGTRRHVNIGLGGSYLNQLPSYFCAIGHGKPRPAYNIPSGTALAHTPAHGGLGNGFAMDLESLRRRCARDRRRQRRLRRGR